MRNVAPRRRLRAVISFWALAAVSLLVSHDAVFAIQAGPGEALTDALRDAGHDYWGVASAVIVAIGLLVGLFAIARVHRLRWRATKLGAAPPSRASARRILRTWGWLALVVAAGFLVQENLEHLASHGHLIGAGALVGPEYPLALPVIAAMTLAAGIIGGLIGGAEAALMEAIATALAGMRRRPGDTIQGTSRGALPRPSVLARRGAGRAPPPVAAFA